MTRIDPVFLLVPILTALTPVSYRRVALISLATHNSLQADGSPGNFRPADDLFEEAAQKLEAALQSHKDPSSLVTASDVIAFTSLQCARTALVHICDVKGIPLTHSCILDV